MQFVTTLLIQRSSLEPHRLIVLATTRDESDANVTVYVVDAAQLDPERDRRLAVQTMPRSGLGAFLKAIADGAPLQFEVSHPTPPPNDPKIRLAFQFAASVSGDGAFTQVEVTQTWTTLTSVARAATEDPHDVAAPQSAQDSPDSKVS